MNSQVNLIKTNYTDEMGILELLDIEKAPYSKRTNYYHPESKYAKAYLGNGIFSKKKFLEIKDTSEKKKWFVHEVQLFVEYLNKIENINYTMIGKRSKVSGSALSRGAFGYPSCVKILVGFRQYTKKFERYYDAG